MKSHHVKGNVLNIINEGNKRQSSVCVECHVWPIMQNAGNIHNCSTDIIMTIHRPITFDRSRSLPEILNYLPDVGQFLFCINGNYNTRQTRRYLALFITVDLTI